MGMAGGSVAERIAGAVRDCSTRSHRTRAQRARADPPLPTVLGDRPARLFHLQPAARRAVHARLVLRDQALVPYPRSANAAISGGRSPSAAWSSCTAFREDACQRSRLDTLQLHDEPDFTNMIPRRRKRADFAVGSEALARVESDRGQVRLTDVEE